MRYIVLLALIALLACISTCAHARQCGGTLVVRTTGGQVFAVVVPKNGGAISARSFNSTVDCTGAFAVDGYTLLCANASRDGLIRYNFQGEPTKTFSLDGYKILPTSTLYYNAHSSSFCATFASFGSAKGRLCGGLLNATTTLGSRWFPQNYSTDRVYDALIGWPNPGNITLLEEFKANGSRTLWKDSSDGMVGGSPSQLSAVSHFALSDNGRRQWHAHSNATSLRICSSDTLSDVNVTCYNASFTSTSATAIGYLDILRNAGSSSEDASAHPTDTCTSILAYWTNVRAAAPAIKNPILTDPTPTSPPMAPSATIPGTQQQDPSQSMRRSLWKDVGHWEAGRTVTPGALTSSPISIAPNLAPATFAPEAAPASPSPSPTGGFATYQQVNFFDCPEPTTADSTPACSMGERVFNGAVSDMAWSSAEFESLNYTSTSSTCPPPSPGESFVCVDGMWTSYTDVNTTTIVATGSVTVYGNVTISESVVISGFGSSLNVNGCLSLNGSIIIELSDDDLDKINKKTGTFTYEYYRLLLSSLNCPFTNSSQLQVQVRKTGKNQCAKVTMDAQTDEEHKLLAGIFSVNRTSCNIWWIILVSVICGVILLAVIILVLVFTFSEKARLKVRPFSAKRTPDAQRVQ